MRDDRFDEGETTKKGKSASQRNQDRILTLYRDTACNRIAEVVMIKTLTIGKAAQSAGVNVETIRFYERRGLIAQPRKPRNGFREYDPKTIARISFIRQAQEIGFSLREIGELLSLRADPKTGCGDVRARALVKRQEVDRKIGQLEQMRAALDEFIATCPGSGALYACTILEAMERAGAPSHDQRSPSNRTSRVTPAGRATKENIAMKTVGFVINGMHCDGCVRAIEAVMSAEPGVHKAIVSFKMGEARVLFDPKVVSEDQLAAAIGEAGYSIAHRSR